MALTKIPASLLDTSSGINGLIYPTSDGTSGQFLKTDGSGNLTFATVTTYTDSDVETYLDGGLSTPTFASATVSGTLTVTGDLDITGDINSYNVTDLDVADKTITLGAGQTEANSGGSGIIIDGSSASILWDETNDKFDLSHGLHIGDSNAIGDATTPALQIGGTTTYRLGMYTTAEGAIIDNANGDDGIIFHTKNANEAMRINASGNVGIGSDNPTSKLSVVGGASDAGISIKSGGNAGVDPFRVTWTGGTEGDMFVVHDSGKVGIGITPNEGKLHIKSDGSGEVELLTLENSTGTNGKTTLTFKTTSTDATKSAQIFAERVNASGHTDLAFRTYNGSTTEHMRIDASGNVGIGTTDPSGILDIYKNATMDINLRGNPPELNFEDLGGTSGQKRARITGDGNKLSIQGLADDDLSVTHNFVDFRLDNGGIQFYGDFPDGSQNVCFGKSAGAAISSGGARNVLLGSRAGMGVTSGDHNVFIGSGTSGSIRGAGEVTTTGQENVGIGTGALGDNISGSYNTSVGHMSMYYNAENSSSNIAVGVNAMLNGGGGGSNVAVGINALKQVGTSSGDSNTAINFEALEDLTTGAHNIGIGYRAGMNLQSGNYNIVIGNNSHNTATGGNHNIVLGYGASTVTGNRNLIVGYDSGTNMTSGAANVLINFSGDSHGIDIASKSNHTVIAGGDMKPAFHNYVHEDTPYGNIDVTHGGGTENFITCGGGSTIPLFSGGNSFSGIFIINDFTRTGDVYLIMTGGGSISIIHQTGGTLVTSSSPGSLQYGIYLSSLGVMFKNGTSTSFKFRLIALRTRSEQ